jgi:hypothetical protein
MASLKWHGFPNEGNFTYGQGFIKVRAYIRIVFYLPLNYKTYLVILIKANGKNNGLSHSH